MYLSVIIPTYNEEKRISTTLLAIDEYLAKQKYDYEIIVVDDGSSDKTSEIVNNFKSMVRNMKLVENKENHGKGFVVRQGMLEAQGDYRVFTDADNSTSIDQIEGFLPFFKEGYDVVIGSRAIRGAKINVHQPFHKELLGKMGNKLIQVVAVWGIKDTQAGFKCFSARAAEDIFPRAFINRWGFDVEALALAKKLGYKIKELPIVWVNDLNTHVKPSAYFQVFLETFKVRWSFITGKYK